MSIVLEFSAYLVLFVSFASGTCLACALVLSAVLVCLEDRRNARTRSDASRDRDVRVRADRLRAAREARVKRERDAWIERQRGDRHFANGCS